MKYIIFSPFNETNCDADPYILNIVVKARGIGKWIYFL